jgi:two-component system KDP operon response regulator KdpE
MTKPVILVIDDEPQIRRLLRVLLESAAYEVREAALGQAGLNEIALRRPEVVVLDLGLPDLPGIEVLRRLREWSQIPVLVLSVVGEDDTKVAALETGADDYLTKPFSEREFIARIRALTRRQRTGEQPNSVKFGAIEIDFVTHVVKRSGREVRLTAKEYALLRLLAANPGRIVTHAQILREVWGPSAVSQGHYLRVYIARLRQKLEETPVEPKYIKSQIGIGYRLITEA